jgi:hypothetical protein
MTTAISTRDGSGRTVSGTLGKRDFAFEFALRRVRQNT